MTRSWCAAAAAAMILASAGSASAAVTELHFSSVGSQPQIYFEGFVPGTDVVDPKLHATFDVTLNSITNGGYKWNFGYNIANTSTEASRLSVIGWDVDPDFKTASGVTGTFSGWSSGNMASLGAVEFCLKDVGGGNCSGGGGGGLVSGASGSGVFSLTFADSFITYTTELVPVYNAKHKLIRYDSIQVPHVNSIAAPTTVSFSNFGIRLQSLPNGLSTVGVPGDSSGIGEGNPVPEPATWAMMILGFFGTGSMLRSRRRMLALRGA